MLSSFLSIYLSYWSFIAVFFLKCDPTIAHGDRDIKDQGSKMLVTLDFKHLSHKMKGVASWLLLKMV